MKGNQFALWRSLAIRHIKHENGTGTEMRPAIVSGIIFGEEPDQLLANFFPIPSNSPKSLCESKFGPVPFSFLKWQICRVYWRKQVSAE